MDIEWTKEKLFFRRAERHIIIQYTYVEFVCLVKTACNFLEKNTAIQSIFWRYTNLINHKTTTEVKSAPPHPPPSPSREKGIPGEVCQTRTKV